MEEMERECFGTFQKILEEIGHKYLLLFKLTCGTGGEYNPDVIFI